MNARDENVPMNQEQINEVLSKQTAPKIHSEDLDAQVSEVQYLQVPGKTLIYCVITMLNGFTVTGESACADPANFNEEVGKSIAFRNAKDKMWSLLGYELKTRLNKLNTVPAPQGKLVELGGKVKTYIGTKVLHALPMSRGEYNRYRGWELPKDENGEDPGYLVEYADSQDTNVVGHRGYVSWSPKDVFDSSYGDGTVISKPASTFLTRLKDEAEQLEDRTKKLSAFMNSATFSTLDPENREDLFDQHKHMREYLKVLKRRIRKLG